MRKKNQFSRCFILIVLSLVMIMTQALPATYAGDHNLNERVPINQVDLDKQFMPPNPDTYPEYYKQKDDNTKETDPSEAFSIDNNAAALSAPQPSSEALGKDLVSGKKFSSSAGSTEKVLVIPISFTNESIDPEHNTAYYQDLMDQLKDYYEKNSKYVSNSRGITIEATIVDPVTSSNTMEYYGQDSNTADGLIDDVNPVEELAYEAVDKLEDRGFNSSSFDKNNDGVIDHLIIIHAGSGQEEINDSDLVWSCSSQIPGGKALGGKLAYKFITIAEDSTLGVCAHEFGHDLGLPDLYDTNDLANGYTLGVGDWDLMGSGSWNHLPGEADGTCPSNLSAWSKIYIGWLTPTNITSNGSYTLYNSTGNDQTYKLWTNGISGGNEYYLAEYRRKNEYDAGLPGEGLLVWHIDNQWLNTLIEVDEEVYKSVIECNLVNACKNRLGVELEQADGNWDLWYVANAGDAGDPFTGTNWDEGLNNFSALPYDLNYSNISSPDAFSYVEIRNINTSGSVATANYYVTTSTPTEQPETLSPAVDSLVLTPVAFSWKMANQAKGYRLQISLGPSFETMQAEYYLDGSSDENLEYTGDCYTFILPSDQPLVAGKTYYWRVAGENGLSTNLNTVYSQTKAFTVSACSDQGYGVMKTDMPTARKQLSAAVVNNKIYAIGGFAGGYDALNILEELDPATFIWNSKTGMPTARDRIAAVTLNNCIYVIGGDAVDTAYLKTVEAYDPATDTWITKMNLLSPKSALAAVVVNGKIYAIGGLGSENEIEEYDPVTDTWTKKADMPLAMFSHVAAAIGNKIYVFGGYAQKIVLVYDTVADTWAQKSAAPCDIYSSGAVAIRDKIYIMAGASWSRRVMQYNPDDDTWTSLPDLYSARESHAIANIGEKVYLIGGDCYPAFCIKTVEEYQIVPFVLLDAPDNLLTISSNANSISLSWDTVDNATGYYVSINDQEIYTSTNSYTITGLGPNKVVTYKVRAVNMFTTSDWSRLKTASTTGIPLITVSANITEGSENGSIITVTLTNGVFLTDGNYNKATVVLNPGQLPQGVKEGSVTRIDNSTLQIGLVGNRTADYDTDLSVSLRVDKLEISTGRYTSPSAVVTFDAIVEAQPSPPSVTFSFDGPNAAKLMGSTSGMEFSLDGGSTYIAVTFSDQALNASQLNAITAANDVRVRIKASGVPASNPCIINILSGPAAPAVTSDDSADTITGIDSTMEFSSDGVNWTKYNSNLPVLTGNIIIRVRIPGTGVTAPGTPAVLTFTASSSGGGGGGGGAGGGGAGGGGGGGGSGGSGPAEVPIDKPPVINSADIAKYSVTTDNINEAMDNAKKNQDGMYELAVNLPKVMGAAGYSVSLPTNILTSNSDAASTIIQISSSLGTVTLTDNTIPQGDPQLSGKSVELVLSGVDKEQLPADVKDEIGNRPVIDIHFNVNGQSAPWENPNAPVTLSIPYRPTLEEWENLDNIVVWYIDGAGNAIEVPSGRYDQATGTVTFTVTHFSQYAVGYYNSQLTDIAGYVWAEKEIAAMVGRGIIKAKTDTTFVPGDNITRAEFLFGLVRALGLTGKAESSFDDVKTTDYYYQEIALAKQLGITNGNGYNQFSPDEFITRQDMMTLMARALKLTNKLGTPAQTANLNQFGDNKLIALYAKDSIVKMVSEGIIQGDGKNINPLKNTTRAEAAVILFRIYNK